MRIGCFRCGGELTKRGISHDCQRVYCVAVLGHKQSVTKRAPTFGAFVRLMREAGLGDHYTDWRLISEGPVY